jgi:hypothetical protein
MLAYQLGDRDGFDFQDLPFLNNGSFLFVWNDHVLPLMKHKTEEKVGKLSIW